MLTTKPQLSSSLQCFFTIYFEDFIKYFFSFQFQIKCAILSVVFNYFIQIFPKKSFPRLPAIAKKEFYSEVPFKAFSNAFSPIFIFHGFLHAFARQKNTFCGKNNNYTKIIIKKTLNNKFKLILRFRFSVKSTFQLSFWSLNYFTIKTRQCLFNIMFCMTMKLIDICYLCWLVFGRVDFWRG